MSDTPMLIGFSGTVATVSLGQWSDVIAIVCGLATTAYMITKLIHLLKKKD